MDKIIDKMLKTIDSYVKDYDEDIKLFKVMLLIFYVYYGEDNKYINPKNKLYKFSNKEKKIIEDKLITDDFLDKKYELYKLGVKYDKLMESTSRIKTGSFYTPEDLALSIVKITISDYFQSKDKSLYQLFRRDDMFDYYKIDQADKESIALALETYKRAYNILSSLKISDLACGTGMFLLSYVNIIIDLRRAIDDITSILEIDFELQPYNLDNIYGFDIQESPLIILSLSLYDLMMRHDFLVSTSLNIRCLDSLKASRDQILTGMDDDFAFDIIFGNPPYIGEKGNKELFNDIRSYEFGSKYYEGKMDYFYYFLYRAMNLIKSDGILGYITTNYFISADGAYKLREFLAQECSFLSIVNFNDIILFPSAPGQHNMIFTLKSKKEGTNQVSITIMGKENFTSMDRLIQLISSLSYELDEGFLYDDNGKIALMQESSYHEIIKSILKKSNLKIGDFISVKQGIVSGADKVSKSMLEKKLSRQSIERYSIKKDDPIFVIESYNDIELEKELLKPFYKNSCIDKFFVDEETNKYILYINSSLDDFKGKYPKTYSHLHKYKEVLCARREVEKKMKPWYYLQWGRSEDVFLENRIVVPQRSSRNKFALSTKDFYGSADIYYLYIKNDMKIDKQELNYYLLGLLNSKLYYFWLYNMGKRKGNLLELYSKPISQIPIHLNPEGEAYKSIVSLVKSLFEINNESISQAQKKSEFDIISLKIDEIIYDLYELDDYKIKKVEDLYSNNVSH